MNDEPQVQESPDVASPDPGVNPAAQKPLSPEEYEKLKEEARENK